ncbi:LOW QUALITY PROTEIN: condensin complex subunit 2 [Apis mellifera]|uniref:Condensin complex subunit 2 n=1 Tax=Apis mellifera TaxID=7460 RepID=A0A7M7KZD0_APIME|nr:LOW QUALITY PROTEIN: condensin complex subunit 2 [Apis mellifera]|eukprot:XP_026295303.1 LOW QUALITY PROTEIN: condensin complex subunit 2 [Apis mellifera]
MATRKSMSNRLIDSTIHSSPASSSPLRRKSILPQKLNNFALSENDDEAERLARRKEITNTSTTTITNSINSNDKRRSLGLSFLVNMPPSQMAERISQCIKLGTENKINPKNAFSLEMIDFMTYMIKKKDANMSNLQVATTSLDVSTKIYGFRVDGVHMDILKMIAGIDKQNKYNENQNNMEKMNSQEVEENNFDRQKQEKKKKKNKQKIFATVDTLKINIETEKPSLITIEADLQTTDMLYQVMLPNHANSKFYPHPYNDILIDTVNNKDIQDKNTVYNIPKIANFAHMEICPPLFYFDFHSWNADDELEKIQSEQSNENRFQFDLNASLSNEDECISTGMNYFDIEVTEEEHIDRCVMISNQVENIVDFREVLTKTMSLKDSEYSFIQTNLNIHWAGPSHWKATNFRKILFSNNAETQNYQSKVKKKNKEIELCYDDETIERICAKFLPSQSIKLHARTAKIEWNEEILTLPPDKHYNIKQANKLYLHTTIFKNSENINDINTTSLINDMENSNKIHINENDTLNYSNNYQEYQENENNAINNDIQSQDEYISETQMPFTGNNLVAAPKLTNKLSIAYCTQPKRIDMKQLKYSIWECLKYKTDKNIQETIIKKAMQQDTNNKMSDSKFFSEIYKRLPNILTKTNIEALSFPISFVSLLHLANEKTLKINSSSDMSDLIIEQD